VVVHYMRNSRGEGTTADVHVLDIARHYGGAWQPEVFNIGDTVSMRLVDGGQVDAFEFQFDLSDVMLYP
jgi:hypothetical protein